MHTCTTFDGFVMYSLVTTIVILIEIDFELKGAVRQDRLVGQLSTHLGNSFRQGRYINLA